MIDELADEIFKRFSIRGEAVILTRDQLCAFGRDVAAEAWDEGWQEGWAASDGERGDYPNPYRANQIGAKP